MSIGRRISTNGSGPALGHADNARAWAPSEPGSGHEDELFDSAFRDEPEATELPAGGEQPSPLTSRDSEEPAAQRARVDSEEPAAQRAPVNQPPLPDGELAAPSSKQPAVEEEVDAEVLSTDEQRARERANMLPSRGRRRLLAERLLVASSLPAG